MTEALLIAELELVRFLRRRETLWLFLLVTLPAFMLWLFLLVTLPSRLLTDPAERTILTGTTVVASHLAVGYAATLAIVNAAVLLALAYYLGATSLRREQTAGTLGLLANTPLRPTSWVLGKAMGVSASLLCMHAWLTLFRIAAFPFVRTSPVVTLSSFALLLWIATGCACQALAMSLDRPSSRLVSRTMLIAHWAVPLAAAQWLMTPAARSANVNLSGVLLQAIDNLYGGPSAADLLTSVPTVAAVVVVSQGITGIGWLYWLARRS